MQPGEELLAVAEAMGNEMCPHVVSHFPLDNAIVESHSKYTSGTRFLKKAVLFIKAKHSIEGKEASRLGTLRPRILRTL